MDRSEDDQGAGISAEMPLPLTRRAFRGAVCQWQTSRADRSEAETQSPFEEPLALRGGRRSSRFYRPAWGKPTHKASNYRCRSNGVCYSQSGQRMAPARRRAPTEAQRSGFGGEMRNAGMGEFSHIGGNERYEGRSDEVRRRYRAPNPTSPHQSSVSGKRRTASY